MKTLRLLVVLSAGLLLVAGTIAMLNYPARAQDSRSYLHLEPPAAPNPAASTQQTSTAKIDAVTAGEIISNTLGDGDNQIHGLIYHNGFLWASTRTYPARVLKINPETLAVEDSVELDEGQNEGEDIVYANGYLWVVLFPTPNQFDAAQLIRIDPNTNPLTAVTAIPFGANELTNGTSLEYAFDSLWVGGLGKIARVDITNPSYPTYEILDYSALAQENHLNFFSSLTSSDSSIWGAMVTFSETNEIFTNGTAIKIDPDSPGDTYITKTVEALFPDDTTFLGDHYYISSEDDPIDTHPSDLYEFANDLSGYEYSPAFSRASYGTFKNPLDPESIWGVYVSYPITLNVTIPGAIKKFDLGRTAVVTLSLPTALASPNELAFDESGNMYAVTWQSPAGIIRYPAPISIPDLSVSLSGVDAVLSWSHADGNAVKYQVWRSTDPNFIPGDSGAEKIGEVVPQSPTTAVTFIDTDAVGNLGVNYNYGIKAVNQYGLVSPLSNRETLAMYPAATITTITNITPTPSEIGEPVTITYSTTSNFGTPTGNVTISDGGNECAGTVAELSCTITFTTLGLKSLEATYQGDTYFTGSVSPVVTHVVFDPSEPWSFIHLPLVVR